MILRSIYDHGGVKVNGQNINNLRYADYTVLIADSEKQLQRILNTVIKESERKGLELNVKKSECMVVSKKQQIPIHNISCKGEPIKLVHKLKYLGRMLTSDAKYDAEIRKRVAI